MQITLARDMASPQPMPRDGAGPVRRPSPARTVVTCICAVLAWFVVPALFGQPNEGFQATIMMNAVALANGQVGGTDPIYPLNDAFFIVSRFGITALLALPIKAGLPPEIAFRAVMLLSLGGLVLGCATILRRGYGVSLPGVLLALLMCPGLFESAWFFNDNVLSAALSTGALAVAWPRPGARTTHGVTAAAAVLWGLAVACRTDAVLLAPAFAVLLWSAVPGWGGRVRHALLAGLLGAAVPLGLYAAFGLRFLDILPLTRRATAAWARAEPWSHMLHPVLKGFAYPGLLAMGIGALSMAVAAVKRGHWRDALLCLLVPLLYAAAYGRMLTEVRYLLPLLPLLLILMVHGARAALRAGRTARTAACTGFIVLAASCFLPPVMLPDQRLHFLSNDNDMPRPSIGRFWSPAIALWWNRTLRDGDAAVAAAVAASAEAGMPGIVVSTSWTADRAVELALYETGFRPGDPGGIPAACRRIGEVFVHNGLRVLHMRAHIPMVPGERSLVTWDTLGAPCMDALGLDPARRVVVVAWPLLLDGPTVPGPEGEQAQEVQTLYAPKLDIVPWARAIVGKSHAYAVARVPLRLVQTVLRPPETEAARRIAEDLARDPAILAWP